MCGKTEDIIEEETETEDVKEETENERAGVESITRAFQKRRLHALCAIALSFCVPPTEQTKSNDAVVIQTPRRHSM